MLSCPQPQFSSLPSPGYSPNVLREPLTRGVFPGHELFHFQFAPLLFPSTSQLLPSPRRECPSPHSWGGDSPHPGLGRTAPPPWEGLCTLPHPLPLRPEAIFESPQGRRRGGGGLDHRCTQVSTPAPGTGRRQSLRLPHLGARKIDLCLAHPHPGSSFRNKIPVPLPWSPNLGTSGQQGQRMLTEPAPPFPTTRGLTSGEEVESQNSPWTRDLCQPGPTPAPIQVA